MNTDSIIKVSWGSGFGVARITEVKKVIPALMVHHYSKPIRFQNKDCRWALEQWDCDENKKPARMHPRRYLFQKKSDALKAFQKWDAIFKQQDDARGRSRAVHPGKHAQDIHEAQWKIMGDIYPDTISALKAGLSAEAAKQFVIETAGRTGLFEKPVEDMATLKAIVAVTRRQKKDVHPVDSEIALGWKTKGYCRLGSKELANAIHSVTKISLSPAAIKKRRDRLGLVTEVNPGLPNKELRTKHEQALS